MKRTGLHSAFTDAGETDKILFPAKTFCHQRADRNRNHGAEMTDHRKLTVAWLSAMNVAVTPAHWSLSRAKVSSRNIDNRFAKCGTAGLIGRASCRERV